jgi:EpsD family peptidyl-prolyl cis-trans isomerase
MSARAASLMLAGGALLLVGCGNPTSGAAASQTAVRVNQQEVTVHQINLLLQQQRGLRPEALDATTRRVVTFLVDQELAVQRARELKIDREQRVVLEVEAARREVLARAYAARIGESAAQPGADEIKRYHDDHPALFSERRIYTMQELSIEASPEQLPALRDKLHSVASASEFAAHLKANGFRSNGSQGERAAEELPADVLGNVARMKDGQMLLLPSPAGALVLLLVGSRAEPLDEARAHAAIERHLLADGRRQRIDADARSMRSGAQIEFIGKYAEFAAPTAPVAVAAETNVDAIRQAIGMKP